MSYPALGYCYPASLSTTFSPSAQLLVPNLPTSTTPPSSGSSSTNNGSDSSRVLPASPSPVRVCPPVSLLGYPGVPAAFGAEAMNSLYNSAYAAQGYVPFGGDPSAFYSPLAAAGPDAAWRNLSQASPWPYDPAMAYPYGAGYGGLDVRRKNATREATSTLKAWLYEHIKNPYPTKGEKIMLAIITKMTLTQVSTWFANARRRLKKENKMQWSPRNRTGDDDDDDEHDSDTDEPTKHISCDRKDARDACLRDTADKVQDDDEDIIVDGGLNDKPFSPLTRSDASLLDLKDRNSLDPDSLDSSDNQDDFNLSIMSSQPSLRHQLPQHLSPVNGMSITSRENGPVFPESVSGDRELKEPGKSSANSPSSQSKPRIWSMADMATPSQKPLPPNSPLSPLHIATTGPAISQTLLHKGGYPSFSGGPSLEISRASPSILNGAYLPGLPPCTVATANLHYRLGNYVSGAPPGGVTTSAGLFAGLPRADNRGLPSLHRQMSVENRKLPTFDPQSTAFKPILRQ